MKKQHLTRSCYFANFEVVVRGIFIMCGLYEAQIFKTHVLKIQIVCGQGSAFSWLTDKKRTVVWLCKGHYPQCTNAQGSLTLLQWHGEMGVQWTSVLVYKCVRVTPFHTVPLRCHCAMATSPKAVIWSPGVCKSHRGHAKPYDPSAEQPPVPGWSR